MFIIIKNVKLIQSNKMYTRKMKHKLGMLLSNFFCVVKQKYTVTIPAENNNEKQKKMYFYKCFLRSSVCIFTFNKT